LVSLELLLGFYMKGISLRITLLFIAFSLLCPRAAGAQTDDGPVVRAVLFYSPNCGHCHHIINELLLPMLDEYGDRLQVIGIDVSQSAGSYLYETTIQQYDVVKERRGVPTLVIQDLVLVGSQEIPDQFPSLVEEGLAAGGIDWPAIPGLDRLLAAAQPEPSPTLPPPTAENPDPTHTAILQESPTPDSTTTATSAPAVLTIGEDEIPVDPNTDPPDDPVGTSLATAVLAGMVIALVYSVWRLSRPETWRRLIKMHPANRARSWAIPILCLLGLGIASYLAYVEVNQVEAVCGPVGECNVVQTSEYALLLGIPVAVWGVLNYLGVAALWTGQRFLAGRRADLSQIGLLGLLLFGTLFSVYLTCLELFTIHAICMWCLGSAVTTTALMLIVLIPTTHLAFETLETS
jgi:uncharacterized membrane protein